MICDVETKSFETVHETARPALWLRKSGLVVIAYDSGRIATLDPVRRIERPIDVPFLVSSVGASDDDTPLVLHESEAKSDIWLLEEKAAAPPVPAPNWELRIGN